jgi:hypothetical protein
MTVDVSKNFSTREKDEEECVIGERTFASKKVGIIIFSAPHTLPLHPSLEQIIFSARDRNEREIEG